MGLSRGAESLPHSEYLHITPAGGLCSVKCGLGSHLLCSSRSLTRKNRSLLCEGLVANTGLARWVLTKALLGARALLSPKNCQAKGKTHEIIASKRRCKPPETERGATLLKTLAILSGSNPDINPLTSTKNKNCLFCSRKDTFIFQRGAERVEIV